MAAVTRSAVPDVLAPGLDVVFFEERCPGRPRTDLDVVFCGINPGFHSDAKAAHFANPRNDFWRLLHAAGFTPRLVDPSEQDDVLAYGIGITNAALRTTKGSSDLRKTDFEGSAERLERIALELAPRAIGFVGKEAFRGPFGGRPQHGLQDGRLGETLLFVLPSTSPANAAVPWDERLALVPRAPRARPVSALRIRRAARVILLDSEHRVLLTRFSFADGDVWTTVGGGVEPGETHAEAARRELVEEAGLEVEDVGACVWTREHAFRNPVSFDVQRERYFLVRTGPFEPTPGLSWEALAAEGMTGLRWWALDEILAATETRFAPRSLGRLLQDLLRDGPPATPIDVGE